ncbi:anti-phage ZorAB system protein ZorA [Derxia lacustris]|uniref:anti-phage ZorAB system protein ZorA n=1 Tax=Derxia lacustris TaxID=764842 RepID=UPI000A173DB3|nr:anti-phage ZorAB system protein ZorA [Derxia lacustris]
MDRIDSAFKQSETLRHCWHEYKHTLDPQKTLSADGMLVVSRWRATALASTFFNESVLIDSRINSEFFKHLPGLMTGLGIIGTFFGLIHGLQGFDAAVEPEQVGASLKALLDAVGHAFIVSASAIFLAILATGIEKWWINHCYAAVEKLCGAIDELFESGSGAEYLQRLANASETSATQAMHIKEALVSDLKTILTELTERQMATLTASSAQMAQTIASSITEGLKAPLEEISGAVKNVSSQQGDAVNRLLTDVLASFASRMEGMFGGQLSGMSELLKETAQTMQTTAQRFDQLAGRIEQAGSGAADKMALRMEALMESMAARQAESDARMLTFVDQLRGMVQEGQGQTAELMVKTFAELGETSAALVRQLQAQSERSNADVAERTQKLATEAEQALAAQGKQLGALAQAVEAAAQTMQTSVERMRSGVDENVGRMASGAERLNGASIRLESSLNAMSSAADAVDAGIESLTTAAKSLANVTAAAQQALGEQREARSAVAGMVSELRALVDGVRRDAGMNTQLVGSLESAAGKLAQAQTQADSYLKSVSDTLVASHAAFASGMEKTLRQGNASFHQELGKAVEALRGAIQDLGDTLDGLPRRP